MRLDRPFASIRAAMPSLASFAAGAAVVASLAAVAQDAKPKAPADTDRQMADAMAKAAKLTAPGGHHRELERFLGTWTISSTLSMAGQTTPPEPGTVTWSWLMEGRWLKAEGNGSMMGMPFSIFQLLGYDNFKMSFVWTGVSNLDTAMVHAEGDMDPSGASLILYGTLDEYLTGEHDKMVKYLYRFESPDRMTLEVHDLPIGERNTKVMEFTFERMK